MFYSWDFASAYVKIRCHILFSKSRFTWSLFCRVNTASWSLLLFACDFLYFGFTHCTRHLVTSRCSYHWLVFHSFKLRDGPFVLEKGMGDFQKRIPPRKKTAKQNTTKEAVRKKLSKCFLFLSFWFLMLKKILAQAIVQQNKIKHSLKVWKMFHASEESPTDGHWAVWSFTTDYCIHEAYASPYHLSFITFWKWRI